MKTEKTRLSDTFFVVAAASVTFFVLGACLQGAYDMKKTETCKARYLKMTKKAQARAEAAEDVISLVEADNSDYYNDVLSGTDEYETYRKLHASCE